jgi:NADPH:quinone reductase-like Zn-dependent oxidoreductase
MKAVVITKYGKPRDVLKIEDVEKPSPADHQVLVRVRAVSLNVADLAPIRGVFIARLLGTGLRKPKREIVGTDLAGEVEAVGRSVTRFNPGDEVFGGAEGSLAEYACAAEDRLALKPPNVTFEAAACVPVAGTTALTGARYGRIQAGERSLVYGASGALGTLTLQVIKSFGAEVTAVCSTRNLDNARSLGADRVIDYTREDFTENSERYEIIFAVNGNHSPSYYSKALGPTGRCVVMGGSVGQIARAALLGRFLSKKAGRTVGFMGIASINQEDLAALKDLLAAGKIRPLIERRYAFTEAADALEYFAGGHAQGKVVIDLHPEGAD